MTAHKLETGMYAEMVEGKWRQYQGAAHALWEQAGNMRSGAGIGGRLQASMSSLADYARRRRPTPKISGGLLIAAALLAATYLTAGILADGAASDARARSTHAMVLQQAAANYRQARAQCQSGPADSRGACIAEAHADESRARALASQAPQGHVAALRALTDAAIDAGDQDSIVIEPACNVVARGQASLCEIQVRFNSANGLAEMTRRVGRTI